MQYTLTDYFSDFDMSANICNNYAVNFSYVRMNSNFSQISSGSFTLGIRNWSNTTTPIFNATTLTASTEYFQIIANDTYSLLKSNNFSVNLTPVVTVVETPTSGGGGGGGGATRPVSLKILFPDKISAFKYDEIVVPITLLNTGQTSLNGITLKSTLAKNENFSSDIKMNFGIDSFTGLGVGEKQMTNLTIAINTKKTGRFEVTINATISNPVFNDWGKFFVDILETNKTDVEQIILFTNELIVQNPECAELAESLNRAKKAINEGNADDALQYTNEVVRACRNAISQRPSITKVLGPERDIVVYLIFATLGILLLIFVYHIFNRIKMQRYGAI